MNISPSGDISEVLNGIFISNAQAATDLTLLKKLGIHRIVVAGAQLQRLTSPELIYLHLPVRDNPSQDIRQYFKEVNAFIEVAQLAKEPVLVHCRLGQSRSAAFVLAFLIGKLGLDFGCAISLLRRRRPSIRPNPGFVHQLQAYDSQVTLSDTYELQSTSQSDWHTSQNGPKYNARMVP